MPNVMAALPNIGGALCSTPQSLADARALPECRAITLPNAKPVEISRVIIILFIRHDTDKVAQKQQSTN